MLPCMKECRIDTRYSQHINHLRNPFRTRELVAFSSLKMLPRLGGYPLTSRGVKRMYAVLLSVHPALWRMTVLWLFGYEVLSKCGVTLIR